MWSDEAWYCIGSVSCTSCNANAYATYISKKPGKALDTYRTGTCLTMGTWLLF